MRHFSFSNSIFKRLVLQTPKNQGLFGKRLNIYKSPYLWVGCKQLNNTVNNCSKVKKRLNKALFFSSLIILSSHNIHAILWVLTLSQTSPGFNVSAVQVCWKLCEKRRNCSWPAISPFPTAFSMHSEEYPPVSLTSKLWSANSFSSEESKICRLEKSYKKKWWGRKS